MEITAKGKLKYNNDGYNEYLYLIVTFKLPGNIFRSKKKETLSSTLWIKHNWGRDYFGTYGEFQESLLFWINNQNKLIEETERIVLKYIGNKKAELESNGKHKLFKSKLKDLKEIEVKVKI